MNMIESCEMEEKRATYFEGLDRVQTDKICVDRQVFGDFVHVAVRARDDDDMNGVIASISLPVYECVSTRKIRYFKSN